MITVAICDDEPNARAQLSALIRAQRCPCEILEYASAQELLAEDRECSLLLLDIQLDAGHPNGMELARRIREKRPGKQPVIIFVTGYDRYVFDAFDVGAFQYLLKPVDEERFAQVFARAVEEVKGERDRSRRSQVLTLRSASASRTVPLENIYYIESSDHKVVLRLEDGVFSCYGRLWDLERELEGRFFRIHKGYLVNLSYIGGYTRTEVTLTNGERLLLSKYKYQEFVRAYLRFLKGGDSL